MRRRLQIAKANSANGERDQRQVEGVGVASVRRSAVRRLALGALEDAPPQTTGVRTRQHDASEQHRKHPRIRRAVLRRFEDGVFRERAREERRADQRQAADDKQHMRQLEVLGEAADVADVFVVVRGMNDGAGRQEQHGLEARVRDEVEERRERVADANGDEHPAELRRRRIGDALLEVCLPQRRHAAEQRRAHARHDHRQLHVRRQLKHRRCAHQQIHTSGHHGRRVDQRRHRRGPRHRRRQPEPQRPLRALRGRRDKQANSDSDRTTSGVGRKAGEAIEGAAVLRQQHRGEQKCCVADGVGAEGQEASLEGPALLPPKRDEQERRDAHTGPADQQHSQVAGHDEQAHGHDEEVEEGEEAVGPLVVFHVGDGVDEHTRGDTADHGEHDGGEAVDGGTVGLVRQEWRPAVDDVQHGAAIAGKEGHGGDEHEQRADKAHGACPLRQVQHVQDEEGQRREPHPRQDGVHPTISRASSMSTLLAERNKARASARPTTASAAPSTSTSKPAAWPSAFW